MGKIILAGLKGYDNIGDQILIDTCRYLVREGDSTVITDVLDLQMKTDALYESGYLKKYQKMICKGTQFVLTYLRKVLKEIDKTVVCDYIQEKRVRLLYRTYYQKMLNDADALIFVGGAYLKYKGEEFQYSIRTLLEIADEKGIPVMFNAVGIEGYDAKDIRCRELKQAINRACVKVITTRDSVQFLGEHFIESPQIAIDAVGDGALWLSECYGISSNGTQEKEYDVGINVTYLDLFATYRIGTVSDYIHLFEELSSALEKRNLKYCFFTNGKISDYNDGLVLLKKIGIDTSLMLPRAVTPEQYLNQIKRMRCVIPLRLHAAITAYALNIPTAGILWNDKTRLFLSKTGQENYFFTLDQLSIDHLAEIVERLSCSEGIDFISESEKEKTRSTVETFVKKWVN